MEGVKRKPFEEEDNSGDGENHAANGVRPSLPFSFQNLNISSHPVGGSLPAEELHGDVEGGVDVEVRHDED